MSPASVPGGEDPASLPIREGGGGPWRRRVRRLAGAAGLVAAALAPIPVVTADDPRDQEFQQREVYIPLPEFRPYFDRDRLTVEEVTFVLARRPDRTEVLVAREVSGWEHVILEAGGRLTFYNLGRQPLRRGPGRHVAVRDWSGGAHCCGDYHVFHVEGSQVRREGLIRAGDCELRVADLDHDGTLELIACDARFAYAFDLPFSESPFVPLVYAFRDRAYTADNRRYPQVFRYRIAQERRRLHDAQQLGDARGARRAVISMVLHTLYAGRVTEAWCTFGRMYRWADAATVRQEILARLRKSPDPDDLRLPLADLGYTLAPPDRCP